jgi:ketosteroid isomerase-like protein
MAESAELRAFRQAYEEFVAAFNEGDLERASGGFRDDFEHHLPPGAPERVLTGREAWIGFFGELREMLEGWQTVPREITEIGPRCFVVEYENTGTGRTSGLVALAHVWGVIELDGDGRVHRAREFLDRDEAFAAARDQDPEEPGP